MVEKLGRHPSKSARLGWRGHRNAHWMVVQRIREPEVSDACRAIAIDQNVGLHIHCQSRSTTQKENSNAHFSDLRERMASHEGISVHERRLPAVEVGKVFIQVFGKTPTSFSRLVSGHTVMKSMIVPCSIHSETIMKARADFTAPTSGNRFGCLNCFHRTTSRQNFYPALVST